MGKTMTTILQRAAEAMAAELKKYDWCFDKDAGRIVVGMADAGECARTVAQFDASAPAVAFIDQQALRAALAVLREPTMAMQTAAYDAQFSRSAAETDYFVHGWQAAIDALLAGNGGGDE